MAVTGFPPSVPGITRSLEQVALQPVTVTLFEPSVVKVTGAAPSRTVLSLQVAPQPVEAKGTSTVSRLLAAKTEPPSVGALPSKVAEVSRLL